ncbi:MULTISPECIES: CopG family ribbon-helix-helix protein [Burkholderia]|uniref:CopG family ribbon-helix-helix protein n=1 Tax=Burkholderia TaxID=32008 RepID=UPI000F5ABBB3|nr:MULTISPECIES: ribbon-helix-helix protein, CopG family [unclassified Burkholderia]RQV19035.1 ribbon-helix-helix protein, CopG family [Burkholderia cenocepacia]MBP0712255.1 ribbon-helix-helix protein, CopG family [Burkholderia sp. AcTa6-5]RQV23888.1 ribbon-helix-helix protein, CopG family [Burkholderia cenocepacia]RQV66266.1 ribbon-helix-helix protein, CopG family [Burkholderia cenocepacia]RQV67375.1 ribbon-helix-helix protein, CopG family [Burkholderia cenocepacia]
MRTIPIDLSDDQHAALSLIAAARNRSRAEIIGDAIDAYIARHEHTLVNNVFGLWKGREIASQEDLRSEW